MPDMPAAFYAPCIGALVATIGILWRWGLGLQAQLLATSKTSVEALGMTATALDANTDGLQEVKNEVARLAVSTTPNPSTGGGRGQRPAR